MSTTTTTTVQSSHVKRLEGIQLNHSLRGCLGDALLLSNDAVLSTANEGTGFETSHMTKQQASAVLIEYNKQGSETVPLLVLRAMSLLLGNQRVEKALKEPNRLEFSQPAHEPETAEKKKYRQRMERLALAQEERSYSKLTHNLGKEVADDVTMKSMTYAASIGLNMIVAPISFGVFMYFFAGGLIDFFWARLEHERHGSSTDNRKVIAGVVSGVMMLFIEMLLFVIRTNEMDKAMRKKSKSKKVKPFGPYSSASVKTFKGE